MLYIKNAHILTPNQRLENGAVLIEGTQIRAVGTPETVPCPPQTKNKKAEVKIIDADGLILSPGFIDLQLNGAFGHDFTMNPETIWEVAPQLPQYGICSFLPTIITAPLEVSTKAQMVLQEGPPPDFMGATPLGLHLEGPFLNVEKKGAHNPAYIQKPSLTAIANWYPKNGVRLVTLAPEQPGALAMIKTLAKRGIVVSAGHTLASFTEAQAALEAGIGYATHLFNAMPLLGHREPGLVGAVLADPNTIIGLIPDGIHVHPAMVSLVWRLLGSQRLNLVTDAMAGLGLSSGTYRLGDFEVIVDKNSTHLADGTLAGSILSLDAALRNLIRFTGCSLQEALPTITTTPATLLGLSQQIGQVAPGFRADLVLLDSSLNVMMTIVRGMVVYDRVVSE